MQADDIADLIVTTQKNLGKMRWTEIATDVQEHHALPKILKKEKVEFDSGYGITRNIMKAHSGAAKHQGMFASDSVNVGDVMMTITVPWRHTTTNYAFERREFSMNRKPSKLVSLVKVRRVDGMISLAELMEETMWGKPEDSTDETTPYGLLYWIVKSATTGFNGGNPSGFSAGCGGKSSTTYPRWANYTFGYDELNKNDAIPKLRTAFRKTSWKSPVKHPGYARGKERRVFYVNEETIQDFEDVGEAQNENLGRDVASMDDEIVFKKCPIRWVPYLDNDSTNPIYGVDWSVFYPVFLKGEYMHEEKPEKVSGKHTTYVVYVDTTWNTICTNRRKLLVGSK